MTLDVRGGDRPEARPAEPKAQRRPPARRRRRRRLWQLIVTVATVAAATVAAVLATRGAPAPVNNAQFRPGRSLVKPAGLVSRPPIETTGTLRVGALRRSYLIVAPRTGTAGLPLLVDLAGSATTPREELRRSGFGTLAATSQAVLAFPAATGPWSHQAWNDEAGCCQSASANNVNDVGFVLALVKTLERRLRVDPDEVYLEGYSNGAKLAFTVVCQDPAMFAAVATFGATPQVSCPHNHTPVSLFLGIGSLDTETPIAGAPTNVAGSHRPIAQVIGDWRTLDRCGPTAVTTQVDHVSLRTYRDCAGWTSVSYVLWKGQDHQWPRSPGLPDKATAATLMWQFFSHQSRTAS